MGLLIKTNEVVNNPNLPFLPYETNKGSLILIDNNIDKVNVSSYANAINVLDPASNTYNPVINLVNRAQSKLTARGYPEITLQMGLVGQAAKEHYNSILSSQTTSKGGILVKLKPEFKTSNGSGGPSLFFSNPSTGLLNDLFNQNRNIFVSFWGKTVNPILQADRSGLAYLAKMGGNLNVYFATTGGELGETKGNLGTHVSGSQKTAGDIILRQAAGNKTGELSSISRLVTNFQSSAVVNETIPEIAIYRIYIEDLTYSGKTWLQAKANDDALFNLAFGSNGRLSNDSWI